MAQPAKREPGALPTVPALIGAKLRPRAALPHQLARQTCCCARRDRRTRAQGEGEVIGREIVGGWAARIDKWSASHEASRPVCSSLPRTHTQ